jgi:hypothetical protein
MSGAQLNGSLNTFRSTDSVVGLTDNGMGNQVTSTYNGNPYDSLPSNYQVAAIPYKGSNTLINRFTSDWF